MTAGPFAITFLTIDKTGVHMGIKPISITSLTLLIYTYRKNQEFNFKNSAMALCKAIQYSPSIIYF
jgi:hypothetical protein